MGLIRLCHSNRTSNADCAARFIFRVLPSQCMVPANMADSSESSVSHSASRFPAKALRSIKRFYRVAGESPAKRLKRASQPSESCQLTKDRIRDGLPTIRELSDFWSYRHLPILFLPSIR